MIPRMRTPSTLLAATLLLACSTCTPAADPWPCRALLGPGAGPSDVQELQQILDEVRTALYVGDADLAITLEPHTDRTSFFAANLDTDTISFEPRERACRVYYLPALFDDPPPRAAVAAILAHEVEHVRDYAGMDTDTLVEFALGYALSDDNSAYERATDLKAMERGCAAGLVQYREWLYDRLASDPEAVEKKKREYWTPEELRAWIVANEPE